MAPLASAAGATRLLYLGFYWGGKIAMDIASDEQARGLCSLRVLCCSLYPLCSSEP